MNKMMAIVMVIAMLLGASGGVQALKGEFLSEQDDELYEDEEGTWTQLP